MTDTSLSQTINEQTFNQPINVDVQETLPTHGLFQPYFPLSEADYLRLKIRSSVLTGLGAGILTFGISYILPKAVSYLRALLTNQTYDISYTDVWIGTICIVIGGLLILWGFLFSRDKRNVMKRIKIHFRENPGQPEIRLVDR